jgi:hypothetical protein
LICVWAMKLSSANIAHSDHVSHEKGFILQNIFRQTHAGKLIYMERSGLHQIKAVKVKRRWNGAMPSRMGHRNLQENQTCGTHVCFQNPSRCEFASQLPRNQGTLRLCLDHKRKWKEIKWKKRKY